MDLRRTRRARVMRTREGDGCAHIYVCVTSARGIVRARDARGERWVRSMVGIGIRIESFAPRGEAPMANAHPEIGGRGD